ncbi:MAG: peptide chain release factor N(5)-glutamine methyltransferase [Gemmatimonadetes bacterium]|nr:peptide chain release factor N(5)-glutamine methyltransferase [Gemmatimonadota bacterium]
MTVGAAAAVMETMLVDGAAYLAGRGVEDARLEAEHLLAHLLGVPRLQLYLDLDRPLGPREAERYQELLRRRSAREPLQYIVGLAPFRNLDLRVDSRVAIPRPETEYLLDVLMELVRRDGYPEGESAPFESALEIGTGSGAIAISLATEAVARSVTATDVSPEALAVAAGNARRAGAREIEFLAGDSLAPVSRRKFDLVISNPPYLTRAEWLTAQPEVREWEPRVAMHGGGDGLDVVRSVAAGVEGVLRPGGWFALEVGSGQVEAVVALLRSSPALGAPVARSDLTGRGRYVFARWGCNIPSG